MNEFKFDSSGSVILVDVVLKGRITETLKMALDTGATYLMIPWKISESLGLKAKLSKVRTSITTASGTEQTPIINLKSVKAFGREVKNIKAIVHDLPPTSYVDGLLGLSFMRNFKWEIDFHKGIIRVYKYPTKVG